MPLRVRAIFLVFFLAPDTTNAAEIPPIPDELVTTGTLIGQASSCGVEKDGLRRMIAYMTGLLGVLSNGDAASHDAWAASLMRVVVDAKNSQATNPSTCSKVMAEFDRIKNNLLVTGFLPP